MTNSKKARFYKVSKRDGNGESWFYFVPAQIENQVRLDAEQQYVRTEVTFYNWHPVTVQLDQDGVYFVATIDGTEWRYYQGDEGHSYLTSYLGPEYDDANRSYFS
jgi:hypothetical protein